MKKYTTILLFAFCLSVSAQIEKKYYSNNTTLKETGNHKNGLKDGKWEEYFENGNLKTEGSYVDGERKGEWKVYFETGQLNATGSYESTKFPTPGTWKFYTKEGEVEEFNCPVLTKEQFSDICHSIYERLDVNIPGPGISYGYQEKLWEYSCAIPGIDKLPVARIKIQLMWNTYRTLLRCYNYPTLFSSEKNIAKFSLDTGFTAFLTEAIKRYNLDMNFIDPGDKKTVLDFTKERELEIQNSPPVNKSKVEEYQQIYKLLRDNGAKHSRELNK